VDQKVIASRSEHASKFIGIGNPRYKLLVSIQCRVNPYGTMPAKSVENVHAHTFPSYLNKIIKKISNCLTDTLSAKPSDKPALPFVCSLYDV
jgi:hypothetical protein